MCKEKGFYYLTLFVKCSPHDNHPWWTFLSMSHAINKFAKFSSFNYDERNVVIIMSSLSSVWESNRANFNFVSLRTNYTFNLSNPTFPWQKHSIQVHERGHSSWIQSQTTTKSLFNLVWMRRTDRTIQFTLFLVLPIIYLSTTTFLGGTRHSSI